MSNFDIYKAAMNDVAETIATTLGYDVSKGGYDPAGGVYRPRPDKSFIRCDMMINDGDERTLADGELRSNYPIIQLMVMVPKSPNFNPEFKLLNDIESIKALVPEGTLIGEARVRRFTISKQLTNGETEFSNTQESTHVGHAITLFCTAQQ